MSGARTAIEQLESIIGEAWVLRLYAESRSDPDNWRTFEQFKERVNNLALEPWEYEQAIARLADALDV